MEGKNVPLVMVIDQLVSISEETATCGIGGDAKPALLDPTHTGRHLLPLEGGSEGGSERSVLFNERIKVTYLLRQTNQHPPPAPYPFMHLGQAAVYGCGHDGLRVSKRAFVLGGLGFDASVANRGEEGREGERDGG